MKQVRFTVFALSSAMLLTLGVALAQQQNDMAIEDIVRQLEVHNRAADVESAVTLFTEDVLYSDAFGQFYEGHDGIRHVYQGRYGAGFTETSFDIIETEVLNDTAYQLARYTAMNDEGERLEGYYLAILSREHGEWRFSRVISNVIMPEPRMTDVVVAW